MAQELPSNATSPVLRAHIRASLVLGMPLVAAQITQMLIGVTDAVMMGWLGVEELAAGTLASQLMFLVLIFGLGFAAAIVPLVASALGRGDEQSVRRSARMGLWLLFMIALAFMPLLFFSENILLALGQKPELASLAQTYISIAQWSLIPAFLAIGMRNILTSLERTTAILIVTLLVALLNGFLNYSLIFGNFGAPRLEMEGAAIATVLANLAGMLAIALIVWRGSASRPYQFFARLWRPDWAALKQIFFLGIPISLMILAEAGLFSAASIMIGWYGAVPLAAHGIALQIASLAFMVPLGLSQVATVRVGNAVGRGDRISVGRASRAVIVLTLIFTVISATTFIAFPEQLVRLFLDKTNPQAVSVLEYAIPLLWMAAAFQIVDGLQAVAGGSLRGLSDTRTPMIIAVISYWPIGLGVAWLLSEVFAFGGAGVWAGLVAGLSAAAFMLVLRFEMREKLGLLPSNEPAT